MPDHLGKDQRKTKDEDAEDKPIQGIIIHFLRICSVVIHVLCNVFGIYTMDCI